MIFHWICVFEKVILTPTSRDSDSTNQNQGGAQEASFSTSTLYDSDVGAPKYHSLRNVHLSQGNFMPSLFKTM